MTDSSVEDLQQRLEGEQRARREAESLAESGTRALHDSQRKLQFLQEVAAAANKATSVEEALRTVLALTCAHTGRPLGQASFRDPGAGPDVVPSKLWHLDDTASFDKFRDTIDALTVTPALGLPGRKLVGTRPVWIIDVGAHGSFPGATAAATAGIRSGFGFAVMVRGDVMAAVELFSPAAEEPDADFLEAMVHVGIQLGHVIERAQFEAKLVHDAFHDPLTGLPNRALFVDRLRHRFAQMRRAPHIGFAVLFIDIDHFKVVNDGLGHPSGDIILIEVARRMASCLRAEDTVARLGGDEFAVLLTRLPTVDVAIHVAQRLQREVSKPISVQGHELRVTASMGMAQGLETYSRADELLRDADAAMYRAKTGGKDRYVIFDPSMHQEAMVRLRLEAELRRAVDRTEWVLHYQPIVALDTGAVVGFEALVRWQHPERGLLAPAAFLPLAEEIGLIVPIGRWVIREACARMTAWRKQTALAAPLFVSVNVPAVHFTRGDLTADVTDALTESALDAGALRLEITESQIMANPATTLEILRLLRSRGVSISIDDFGTGYSSLSYLATLPFDSLKIDRSFIHGLESSPARAEIVRMVVALARELDKSAVAEGIENEGDLAVLRTTHCPFGQGYLFSRPVAADVALAKVTGAATPLRSTVDSPPLTVPE